MKDGSLTETIVFITHNQDKKILQRDYKLFNFEYICNIFPLIADIAHGVTFDAFTFLLGNRPTVNRQIIIEALFITKISKFTLQQKTKQNKTKTKKQKNL